MYTLPVFSCQTDKKNSKSFPCTDADGDSEQKEMSEHTTTLTLTDQDGYNGGILKAGLSPDWVVFGDHTVDRDVTVPRASRKFRYDFNNYPVENSSLVVPNPKDIVTEGLGDLPALRISMEATLLEMIIGQWDGSIEDAAQAYSAPVFMLMQAVDGMAQAKALGTQEEQDEAEEEKRKKNFILLIVSVLLMVWSCISMPRRKLLTLRSSSYHLSVKNLQRLQVSPRWQEL